MDIIKSDIVSLHGAAISMIGGRPENQDDMGYLDTPLGFLIVVCDGMGGGPGGKTASYIVKHALAETILECSPQTPRDHALKMAAARAHQALEEKMKDNPALNGMGSTFVAILLNSQSAVVAHSGDSRCYRLHGKKCLFRTQDHSLVAELVRKKVMTEEDARQSPQANVITRGLGSTNNHVPEIDEIPYKKGDRFVLCTDGVWGSMKHQELLKSLTQQKDQQQLLTELSTQVDQIGFSKGGGHDNHTIAMFELEKDSLLKDSFSWRIWAMLTLIAVLIFAFISLFIWLLSGLREQKVQFTSQTTPYITQTPSLCDNQNDQTYCKEKIGVQDSITDSDAIANGYDSLLNDNSIFQSLKSRQSKDSDGENKQNAKREESAVPTNPLETTNKIIERYESAKAVGEETVEKAQKKLDAHKEEIHDLFEDLSEQTKLSEARNKVEAISRVIDKPVSWYVNKEPDKKTNLYVPTRKAIEEMNKQIDRLRELQRILEKK